MLNNAQKVKECNQKLASFKIMIVEKYKKYKKELENSKSELKKHNRKVWWKSLSLIALFALGGILFNYIFLSLFANFKESPFGDVGNFFGLISAAIKSGNAFILFYLLWMYPILFTVFATMFAYVDDAIFNFKTKGNIILNEKMFKSNYMLNKKEIEKEYKEIDRIVGKKELQEAMFKVNKKLNNDGNKIIDIGHYVFICEVYNELITKMVEYNTDNENKRLIEKKLNYVLNDFKLKVKV